MFTKTLKTSLLVFYFLVFSMDGAKSIDSDNHQTVSLKVDSAHNFSNIPLYFISNTGQKNEKALFYANTPNYTLWLTRDGLIFDSTILGGEGGRDSHSRGRTPQKESRFFPKKRTISKLTFLDSMERVEVVPENLTDFTINYFKGKDVSNWKTGIPTSEAVIYNNLYNQIDLRVYGAAREIEYDFIVRPGGKVSDIHLQYNGVENVEIDDKGDILIKTDFGILKHKHPYCYQEINGKKTNVSGHFVSLGENIFGFEVDEFNGNYDLIIDPIVLVYSGYLGGSGYDENSWAVAVDSRGAVYLTGWTNSPDFPLSAPIIPFNIGDVDAFVVKVNPDGKSLGFATYIGGSGYDAGFGIEVDSKGDIYVAGETESFNFPLKKPLVRNKVGAWDGFVLKIKKNGRKLLYSTYFGSLDCDSAKDIAIDAKGAFYLVGVTCSYHFPVKKAFQPIFGGYWDAWVAKINPAGDSLVYASYIGGLGEEDGLAIGVDSKGYAYVTGCTYSEDFPLVNAVQKEFGGISDAFVLRIAKNGKRLLYSTYLGGSKEDCAYGIAVDSKGYASISGETKSKNFPISNPIYKRRKGKYDAFAAKLVPKGTSLLFSTYIGGKENDHGKRIAIDSEGATYITGVTFSENFPVKKAFYKNYSGGGDVFLVKIEPDWDKISFSSYLGGSSWDTGQDIVTDNSGNIYITGFTESDDFPVFESFQMKKAKYADCFISVFGLETNK
jgi:hypothetical protein